VGSLLVRDSIHFLLQDSNNIFEIAPTYCSEGTGAGEGGGNGDKAELHSDCLQNKETENVKNMLLLSTRLCKVDLCVLLWNRSRNFQQ
jgi:hypothetical protein